MSVPRRELDSKPQRRGRRRFPERILTLLRDARMLSIRAGLQSHRFTGIWFVLVRGRVFVRPWNDKPTGWRRAFLREPRGTIVVSGTEIPVRARPARGERLWVAVDLAYSEKYITPASRKWVRGFSSARRRQTTMELLPR